ncbi:MAG: hypothetical protein K8R60_07770 [Burkholderiales bacterium]|nr:hypothetical protein [Burkholderiales bacterium]
MSEDDAATPSFEESFAAAEQAAFRFLVDEHGFELAERQVARGDAQRGVIGRVRYRAQASPQDAARAVELTLAPLQLQLDLQLSKATRGTCAIEELHALEGKGPFPGREHGLYDAMHNPAELAAEFHRLAGVLRACGARFFEDDGYLWDDLAARRVHRAADEEIRRTLALSQELFRAKEWQRLVELLKPIESRLGTRASARLAYAKRKVRER